jgi:hypothetical protein
MPPKTIQHKPTDDLIFKSLEVAARIHDQEKALEALRTTLHGSYDVHDPGLHGQVADTDKLLARVRKDFAQEEQRLMTRLTSLLKAQGEAEASIAEGERALARLHREYADILKSAIEGFPT